MDYFRFLSILNKAIWLCLTYLYGENYKMKKEINSAIAKLTKTSVNEIILFREMARLFNHSSISRSTYVEEIHGNKGLVEFYSSYKGAIKRVELGDLLIITYNKARKEIRICILQAKYKKKKYYRFLNFMGNLFQWELLNTKPTIDDKSKFNFPSNILNFRTDYRSISAYGIFYYDNINGEIDFLYTMPEFIVPSSAPVIPVKYGSKGFHFRCPVKTGSPNRGCINGINDKEAISTCSIDMFEEQVLLGKVGSPLPKKSLLMNWCKQILLTMLDTADVPGVIEEILTDYSELSDLGESILDGRYNNMSSPAALIVVTDSEKYNSRKKQISQELWIPEEHLRF